MVEVTSAIDCQNQLGEGPVWCPLEKALYWLDIKGKSIWRHHPASGKTENRETPEEPGSMTLRQNGKGLVTAWWNGFRFFDPASGAIEIIHDHEQDMPNSRFNDGRCDRQGRFWAGTMDDTYAEPCGSLYRLDADLGYSVQETGINTSNSTAFSPDGRTLYYCDTPENEIWAYDLDVESGNISNKRVFVSTRHLAGEPDGSTVDAEGYLWNAMWGGACLVRWAPDGSFDRKIDLPVHNPTCPMFGGDGLDIIYVTSARAELSDAELAEKPLAGNVFAVTGCGVKGLPEPRFAG
ncbi:MAG TPA: SMP-30/gluconolactonase/LRE family protein [Alphaproteobacteria bacterium]|nr:SMP-30/gluconolactonase/LRE family protein [Alphaproteobacteria bacterium]